MGTKKLSDETFCHSNEMASPYTAQNLAVDYDVGHSKLEIGFHFAVLQVWVGQWVH